MNEGRFVDMAPPEIYNEFLDESIYLYSIRTMYRISVKRDEVKERQNQLVHLHYQKPELLNEKFNGVWFWDMIKLMRPVKWTYYYLYVIIDIFSRYVVRWVVTHREPVSLAGKMIDQTCEKQNIKPE